MRMIPRFSALLLAASCLTAFGQSEYCLDGTVWDEALQGCVVDGQVDGCSLVYDGNNDGLVGSFDLIGFLTEFGAECSPEPTFSCGSPINYQGYDYETVQIGEQCWFAENLRAENYRNGDDIPADLSDNEWTSTNVGAVTVYGEDAGCQDLSPDINACDASQALEEYGRLYNFYAVDDARGLCPSGWHVPEDGEWTVMIDELGGEFVAGGKMKTTYGWRDGGNGTNSSGFSGLPGGLRWNNNWNIGDFYDAGEHGYWWSSTPGGSGGYGRDIYYAQVDVDRNTYNAILGFSVRCIKDVEE